MARSYFTRQIGIGRYQWGYHESSTGENMTSKKEYPTEREAFQAKEEYKAKQRTARKR